MPELQAEMQRLSQTTLEAQGAANVWAGTSNMELTGALTTQAQNAKAIKALVRLALARLDDVSDT